MRKAIQGKTRKQVVFSGTEKLFQANFLPCGLAGVDWSLGGGFAYGRLGELFGNYSSGKTYLLYLFLAMNQRLGGESALIESEFAYNEEFFKAIGGDPSTLTVRPVRRVEDAFDSMAEIAAFAIKEGANVPIAIGWDGIAATGTKHLQDVGMDKKDMSKALIMSQGTQYITDMIGESKICVIATNQVRETIGDDNYYQPTHTPGGKAWPFHASQRMELIFNGKMIHQVGEDGKKDEDTKKKTPPIGHWVKTHIVKNKLAPPMLQTNLPFYNFADEEHPVYGHQTKVGVDYVEALWDFYVHSRYRMTVDGEKRPVVRAVTANGWYALDDSLGLERKFQAKDWPEILAARPDLWQLVYQKKSEIAEVTDGAGEPAQKVD